MPPAFALIRPHCLSLALCLLLWPIGLFAAAGADVGVVVQPVLRSSVADPIEALGTLKANESIAITPNVAESITQISFDSGQRVARGDVLLRLESREEEAVLLEARHTLKEAQSQLDRIRLLARRGDASQSLLDEQLRVFNVANARVAAIEARLQNRIVRAPFSGRVGLRNVSPGAYVSPGDVITTLVDDRRMKLDFQVPSLFVAVLQPGVSVRARARALADRWFEGQIESVDNQVDPVSRSITVRAILENPEGLLKPGLLMEVKLQSNPRMALLIPESALVQERDQHFVFVAHPAAEGLKAMRRKVSIGVHLQGRVEVTEGLQESDQVVVDGTLKLRDGMSIKALTSSPAISGLGE